jgi:hypothetical protein
MESREGRQIVAAARAFRLERAPKNTSSVRENATLTRLLSTTRDEQLPVVKGKASSGNRLDSRRVAQRVGRTATTESMPKDVRDKWLFDQH